jgi:hypothetical protein
MTSIGVSAQEEIYQRPLNTNNFSLAEGSRGGYRVGGIVLKNVTSFDPYLQASIAVKEKKY